MTFGKRESFDENYINYTENIDMLLHDIQVWGYKELTKEDLIDIFNENFSIGRAVRMEISRILDNRK